MPKRYPAAIAALPLLLAFGLGGCEQGGPAEEAGEEIDQAAEETGETARQAAEEVSESIEQAGDEIRQETGN